MFELLEKICLQTVAKNSHWDEKVGNMKILQKHFVYLFIFIGVKRIADVLFGKIFEDRNKKGNTLILTVFMWKGYFFYHIAKENKNK